MSGHATGDAVLKDVAYALRKELRAFDFAYRIGGEEFVVPVPGGDADHTARDRRNCVRCTADAPEPALV